MSELDYDKIISLINEIPDLEVPDFRQYAHNFNESISNLFNKRKQVHLRDNEFVTNSLKNIKKAQHKIEALILDRQISGI